MKDVCARHFVIESQRLTVVEVGHKFMLKKKLFTYLRYYYCSKKKSRKKIFSLQKIMITLFDVIEREFFEFFFLQSERNEIKNNTQK